MKTFLRFVLCLILAPFFLYRLAWREREEKANVDLWPTAAAIVGTTMIYSIVALVGFGIAFAMTEPYTSRLIKDGFIVSGCVFIFCFGCFLPLLTDSTEFSRRQDERKAKAEAVAQS